MYVKYVCIKVFIFPCPLYTPKIKKCFMLLYLFKNKEIKKTVKVGILARKIFHFVCFVSTVLKVSLHEWNLPTWT